MHLTEAALSSEHVTPTLTSFATVSPGQRLTALLGNQRATDRDSTRRGLTIASPVADERANVKIAKHRRSRTRSICLIGSDFGCVLGDDQDLAARPFKVGRDGHVTVSAIPEGSVADLVEATLVLGHT